MVQEVGTVKALMGGSVLCPKCGANLLRDELKHAGRTLMYCPTSSCDNYLVPYKPPTIELERFP